MPFQEGGVRFGLEHAGRCLIADEMGVGKTLQAIALASCYEVCCLLGCMFVLVHAQALVGCKAVVRLLARSTLARRRRRQQPITSPVCKSTPA